MNIHEEPVGHHDQRLHVPLQQHFEVPLEAVPLIVRVRENRNV